MDLNHRHITRAVGRLESGLVYVSVFQYVTQMGKYLTRQPTYRWGPVCPLLWKRKMGLTGRIVNYCFLFTEEKQKWHPVIELCTTLQDASAWSIRSMPILIYQGNTHNPYGSLGRSMRRSAKMAYGGTSIGLYHSV